MKNTVIFIILLAVLLCGCVPKIHLDAATTVTRTGTVTDRAMASEGNGKLWDNSYPYLTVVFEDGTEICLWNKLNTLIPEEIRVGDNVEVTYSLQANTDHWILTNIQEVE